VRAYGARLNPHSTEGASRSQSEARNAAGRVPGVCVRVHLATFELSLSGLAKDRNVEPLLPVSRTEPSIINLSTGFASGHFFGEASRHCPYGLKNTAREQAVNRKNGATV
jgi:hypothetical protein